MKPTFLNFLVVLLFCSVAAAQNKDCNLVTKGKEQRWDKINPIEVANLHNQYLEEAVNIRFENPKLSDEEVLLKLEIPTISKELMSNYVSCISKMSDADMDNSILSNLELEDSKKYYNDILKALTGDKTYEEISKQLEPIRSNIKRLSEQKDKDILLTCLETGLASAKFWLPKEKGGDGLGYKYTHSNVARVSNGDTRFKKDMRGAGYGMVTWSFSAFFGPVGIAGFVYGAVSGAVVSSFLP